MRVYFRMSLWTVVVVGLAVSARPSVAQEPVNVSDLDLSKPAASATVERICDVAAGNIARRYNLNEAQTRATNDLMRSGVGAFIREHEEEVWPVIRELLGRQLQPPDSAEDLKRLGKASRGLAKLAKEAIFEANAEWRKILTAEQKGMHDFDLAEMEKTFAQMDDNFANWEEGRSTEKPIFPTQQAIANGPKIPRKPAPGLPKPKKDPGFSDRIFDTFVQEFIKEYGLDAAQVEAARSILKEFKNKANDFKISKKAEFEAIEKQRDEALASGDYKNVSKADASRKTLLEPVYQLFAQMEGRLMGLLTTTQRERYASKNKSGEPRPATSSTTKKTTGGKKATVTPKRAKGDSERADPKSKEKSGSQANANRN